MKTVQFTNIHLEHFGKHESIKSELGHRTAIEGANATGKSTIKRAIQYIFGAKDENGKEISGIRPHDENGVDIDGLTTVAELTVSVDGAENTLKRTCFQEKNRQGEYTGEDNLQHFVDDVKKGTKKAYDKYVSTIIPATVCISAKELLMKDIAGRRAMLEVFSKHDTDGIIDENPDFEPLRGKLRANTVADLKKACRDKIKDRTKKRDEKIVETRVEESKKVDIDLAELELLKNALNEQIAENKEKQANVDKQFEEYDRKSKDILDLHFELNGLQQKANEELEKKRRELTRKSDELITKKSDLVYSINDMKRDWSTLSDRLKAKQERLENARAKYTEVQNLSFDENSLICSYCGQEYPEEEKERLRAKFASEKEEETKRVTKQGTELVIEVEEIKHKMGDLEKLIKEKQEKYFVVEKELKEVMQEDEELPQSIDISDRPEVKAIKQQIAEKEQAMQKGNSASEIRQQIAEKEQAMQKGNSASEIRQQLQEEYEELQQQINEVQKQFDKAEKNNRIDERVAELKKQQLELSQEIADIEKELSLLQDFEREKARLLEEDLNKNCDYIRFKMSELQQNGELKDVCQILVNGESYDRNLNFSSQLLVHIDICRMFQRLYDVELPILLDNAESIDKDRIPNVSNQLILFQRADTDLRIEVLE